MQELDIREHFSSYIKNIVLMMQQLSTLLGHGPHNTATKRLSEKWSSQHSN